MNENCPFKSGCLSCSMGEYHKDNYERLGEDYQPEYNFCEKIGECGCFCEDGINSNNSEIKQNKFGSRKTGRLYRRKMKKLNTKKHLKVLQYGYKPSLGIDKDTYYVPAKSSRAQRFHKKMSNKRVRHTSIGNYAKYKRVYDYFWEWF